jgi:hypothetical protein
LPHTQPTYDAIDIEFAKRSSIEGVRGNGL